MKSLVVYISTEHKNTEKIANKIAGELKSDIVNVENIKLDELDKYDLIGFGSGIFYGKFHKRLLKLIDDMPVFKDKKVFIFSTSGQGKVEYNDSLKNKLADHGFDVVGSFASKGFDTYGPFKLFGGIAKGRPNEDDLKAAGVFAHNLHD
ncbi:flavodoxin family protein [Clostridium tyrobutyricum]|uniref:flavodoxin family protein n=1 Tax=Clostridium tyrobutyricum TaxID=1519 RepID=UPI0030CF5F0C